MCPVSPIRAPITNTLGLCNSSPTSKIYSISPLKANKRRFWDEIYKLINANSYYGYSNDEHSILQKFKWPTEEDMRARVQRECHRIKFVC
jgi:hypothetical protein